MKCPECGHTNTIRFELGTHNATTDGIQRCDITTGGCESLFGYIARARMPMVTILELKPVAPAEVANV